MILGRFDHGLSRDALIKRIADLEVQLQASTDRIRHAEMRAELAQRSAEQAWSFAKFLGTPRRAD